MREIRDDSNTGLLEEDGVVALKGLENVVV